MSGMKCVENTVCGNPSNFEITVRFFVRCFSVVGGLPRVHNRLEASLCRGVGQSVRSWPHAWRNGWVIGASGSSAIICLSCLASKWFLSSSSYVLSMSDSDCVLAAKHTCWFVWSCNTMASVQTFLPMVQGFRFDQFVYTFFRHR